MARRPDRSVPAYDRWVRTEEAPQSTTELGRPTEAIAAGGGVTLVGAVKAREAQLENLRGS